jgi:hypothetical protein
MGNVVGISRGRQLVNHRLLLESAKISLFLAMVNPPSKRESVADRVERTKSFVRDEFLDSGYEPSDADELVRTAHAEAYAEFVKVH